MSRVALVALAAIVLVSPALAAKLDPSALVLRKADVPAGYTVDRGQTGVRSNAVEGENAPQLPALFKRWGRVTGYQVEFERRTKGISSRADVFKRARGARDLLSWYDREVRKAGMSGLRRSKFSLGQGGFAYNGPSPAPFALVVWRQGRVFAGVAVTGGSLELAKKLARKQQKRIAAALR